MKNDAHLFLPPTAGSTVFLAISFLFHVTLIVLFLTISPLRNLLLLDLTSSVSENGTTPMASEKNLAQVRRVMEESARNRIQSDLEKLRQSSGVSSTAKSDSVPDMLRDLQSTLAASRKQERADRARALAKSMNIPVEEAEKMLPAQEPNSKLTELATQIENLDKNATDPNQFQELKRALIEATKISKLETTQLQANLASLQSATNPADFLKGVTTSIEKPPERVSQEEIDPQRPGGSYGDGNAMMPAAPGKVTIMPSYVGPPLSPGEEKLKNLIGGRDLPSWPGSRIRPASTDRPAARSGPVYLDSWYVIGPWPLKTQEDFERPFPPESGVDLEAEYPGNRFTKSRPLRWQFTQSAEPMVELPLQMADSSSYAYTEVFADVPMVAWLICGLDDRGKVWLNGEPLLSSANSFKGWQVGNEGARPVLLKKGRNTFLVRIDNRPGETRFSMVLYPYVPK